MASCNRSLSCGSPARLFSSPSSSPDQPPPHRSSPLRHSLPAAVVASRSRANDRSSLPSRRRRRHRASSSSSSSQRSSLSSLSSRASSASSLASRDTLRSSLSLPSSLYLPIDEMFSQPSTIDEAREALQLALSSKTMSLADRVSGLNNAVMAAMEFDLEESETTEASERADQLSELLGSISNAHSQGYRSDVIETIRDKYLPRAQELGVTDTAEVVKTKSMVRRYDTVLKQLNSAMSSKNEQILTQACHLAHNLQIDAPEVALAQATLEEIIDDQVLRGERPFSPISAGSVSPALSVHTGSHFNSRAMSVHSEVLPYSPAANTSPGSPIMQSPNGAGQGFWKEASPARVSAAKEILSSDKEYLKTLRSVVEVFRKRLYIGVEKGFPILDEQQIDRVFINVADVYALTTEVVEKTEELAKTSDDELLAKIGQVLVNFMPRFESEYVKFRRHLAGAVSAIAEFSQSNPRFDEFLKTNESFESINLAQTLTDVVDRRVSQYIDMLTKLKAESEADSGQSAQMAVFIYNMALQNFTSLIEKATAAASEEAARPKAVEPEKETPEAAAVVITPASAPLDAVESKVEDDIEDDSDVTVSDVEEDDDDDDSDDELQAMLDARKAKVEARRKKKERAAKAAAAASAAAAAAPEAGDDAEQSSSAVSAANGDDAEEVEEEDDAEEYDDDGEYAEDAQPGRGDSPVPEPEGSSYSEPYPIEEPSTENSDKRHSRDAETHQHNGDLGDDKSEHESESIHTLDSKDDNIAQLPQTQTIDDMMTPPASPMGAPLGQSMGDLELGGTEEDQEPEISEEEKKRIAKQKKDRRKRAELEKAKKMLAAEKNLPKLQAFVEKKSPVRFGPWQRRWLTVSQYNLFYGRQQVNVKNAVFALDNSMNCIPLMVVQEIKVERSRDQRQFYVSARDLKNAQLRRYLFRTKSMHERDSWVSGLNKHKNHLEELLKCPAIRLNTVKTAPRDPNEAPAAPKRQKSQKSSGASSPRSKRN